MLSYSDHIARFSTALADPTRREIMEHMLESDGPLSVRDVADRFGLHANAARLHLDKLVRGGLLRVIRRRERRGGRPAHLYLVSDEDCDLQVPPRKYKLLAEILAKGMHDLNVDLSPAAVEEAFRSGREEVLLNSSPLAYLTPDSGVCEAVQAWLETVKSRGIKARLHNLGGRNVGLFFMSCPFGEFSELYPDMVCEIHRLFEEGSLSLAGEWSVKVSREEGGCSFTLEPRALG